MKAGIIYYLTKSFDFLQIIVDDKSYYFVGDWLKAHQLLKSKGLEYFNIQSLEIPAIKACRILAIPRMSPEVQIVINEQFEKDIAKIVNNDAESELVIESLCKIEKKI
jgi:hypothetical protein